MFIAGVKTIAATHFFKSLHRIMSCTSYWEPDAIVVDFASCQAIANELQSQAATVFAPMMPDSTSLPCTRVVYEDGVNVAFDSFSVAANAVDGGIAEGVLDDVGDAVLPDIVSMILQRKTGKRGRHYNGRMFVPCLAESMNTDGRLSADAVPLANNVAAFFGADQVFNDILCHARHYARILDPGPEFVPVVDVRYRIDLSSRQDRQIAGIHLAY